MSHYSIKDLEHLSAVKAPTIRIWEQRYNLLSPQRTDTNIRYYNDEQLRKLLNVQTLLLNGMKISHISRLSNKQIASEIDKLINDSKDSDGRMEALVSSAIIAATSFDEALFEKIYQNVVSKVGLIRGYVEVIYPLLIRTGQLWSSNDLLPAQEHFLSNLLEKKIFAAINSLPLPANPDQTWILFLTEPEEHELGLLMANYILRQHGKKVIYLGRRVPAENLHSVITQCKPTHIYTFFVRNHPQQELNVLLRKLSEDFKKLNIYISGKQEMIEKMRFGKKITCIKDIDSLVEHIQK